MCGIAGTYNIPDSPQVLKAMLHGLQNRGTDATGVALLNNYELHTHREPRKVSATLTDDVVTKLSGDCGIGHTRYATAQNSRGVRNIQPLTLQVGDEPFALAHNGNFTNTAELEKTILSGVPFFSQSDTERFFRLVLRYYREHALLESIEKALEHMEGACTAVLARPHELVAIRDARGTRPLYWGKRGNGYVVASETCALDDVGVFDWEEVPPGTIMSFSRRGVHTRSLRAQQKKLCSFEWLYFGYPTSTISGIAVDDFRRSLGAALADEHGITTDLIAAVPDSSTLIGEGYARAGNWGSLEQSVITRKHDTGRTFIIPGQVAREKAVHDKFSFVTRKIHGKSITVIDDSIVRSTTSRGITQSLRERGATEVHWRIGSPPIEGACFYGINTPKREQLIAAQMDNAAMCRDIGADSLEFLSLPRFKMVIKEHGVAPRNCCFACMDLKYWHTA